MRTWRNGGLLVVAALSVVSAVGCYGFPTLNIMPYSMGLATPIPIPPWVPQRMEEKMCNPNDFRTPILPPIREGFPPPICEDPPDDSTVLRAWRHVKRGVPYVCEEFRDEIRIATELVKDTIDPPRFFPLIGPAQLHHCHWKAIIYYVETIESSYPFPFRCRRPRVDVIYIDRDHLHAYPCPTPENQRVFTRELAGY